MGKRSLEKSRISRGESRFKLRAVSRGIAIGSAAVVFGRRSHFSKTRIQEKGVSSELRRFKAALSSSKSQLSRLISSDRGDAAHVRHGIFEAHLLMISDVEFERRVCEAVTKDRMNAEWAVHSVCRNLADVLRAADDANLRERALDFEDVAERLMASMAGSRQRVFPAGSIVVAVDVTPSVIAELGKQRLGGIVADHGGWTSHAFIIARELGLPAVAGFKSATRRVHDGDELIIDGYRGELIVNPTADTAKSYRDLKTQGAGSFPSPSAPRGPLKTLDGVEIIIRANVDAPEGFAAAKKNRAVGVGLYRSECLFDERDGFPSEQVQVKAYRSVAALAGKSGAKIRTFDLHVDRLVDGPQAAERNPALGLRGMRLMAAHPDELRKQVRALLRASVGRRIDVLVPMLSDIDELRGVKKILEDELRKLKRKGVKVQMPQVGAMIEVPSAVLMAQELAAESDFLCLGTNDLVQYLLAVDRDNGSVADSYRSLHPAVLRAVKAVLEAGSSVGKAVIVCGEMAASPVYAAVLIGLGARELSMNPGSMPRIRRLVAGVAEEECAAIAAQLLTCRTATEVEELVSDSFAHTWSNMFPTAITPQQNAAKKPKKLRK